MFLSEFLRSLLLLVVFTFLLQQCNRINPDREANRLFVEAYQLTEKAIKQESDDPVAASQNYRKALDNLDKIIQDYPETEVAVNVTQQQTRIGSLTISELRSRVPSYEERARALDDFNKLARYLISMDQDEVSRSKKLVRLALWAFRNENVEFYEEIMQGVRQQADLHWDVEITDPVYFQLVTGYTGAGHWIRAMETIELIQSQSFLYKSLTELISGGLIRQAEIEVVPFITGFASYISATQYIELLRISSIELFDSDQQQQALVLMEEGFPNPEEQERSKYIEGLIGLAYMYSSNGAFETSRTIIQRISEISDDYADFALRDLALELTRRRHTDEAFDIIRSFDRDYFRYTTQSSVSVQLARNGMVTVALTLLDQVPDDVPEKVQSRIEIASILSGYDDNIRSDSLLNQVIPVLDSLESPHLLSQSFIGIADIYLLRSDRSMAAESLDKAETYARKISGEGNLNQTLSEIFTRWNSIGRPDRALNLSAWFRMEHDSFGELAESLFLNAINNKYHDIARSLAGMTERQHYYLNQINTIYLNQRNVSRATTLSYEIRNYYWRAHALADLSDALNGAEQIDEAEKAAFDALQTVQRIREADEHVPALQYVVSRLSAAGIQMNEEHRSMIADLMNRPVVQ